MTETTTKENKATKAAPVVGPECGVSLATATRIFQVAVFDTYHRESFLGSVGVGITKLIDPSVPTAYVGCNPKTLELVLGVNPYWFSTLTEGQRNGVLRHEYYHVVFGHILDRIPADPNHRKVANIATDLAINSFIPRNELPDFGLYPGEFPRFCEDEELGNLIKSFPLMQESEFYFDELMKLVKARQKGNPGFVIELSGPSGEGTLDQHGWGELPEELKEILRDKVRGLISDGVKKAMRTGSWGSVPSEMQQRIEKLLTHEVDWKSIVKLFFGTARAMDRTSTIKKVNKKTPYLLPGAKRKSRARFLFAIDQSGSMADKDVQTGFSELFALSDKAEIDMVNFDTEVDETSFKTWKRGKKHEWIRTRCGGTDFECVQRFANKRSNRGRWSGIFIYTDGYASGISQIVGVRLLWLITETGTLGCVRPGDLVVQLKKSKTPT